jgi:hypothetical protein
MDCNATSSSTCACQASASAAASMAPGRSRARRSVRTPPPPPLLARASPAAHGVRHEQRSDVDADETDHHAYGQAGGQEERLRRREERPQGLAGLYEGLRVRRGGS